jgi:hypothetical protein
MMNDLKVFSPTPLSSTDYEGIRRTLAEDGVAVVKDILPASEQDLFLQNFWQAMSKRNGLLQRDDPSTWSIENTDWYGTLGAGQYKVTNARSLKI